METHTTCLRIGCWSIPWIFGMMLTLYRGASVEVRSYVSEKLGITAKVLESWLVTLNTVRNICAHHGRLWNRTLGTKPMIPNRKKPYRPRCAWRAQEIEAVIGGRCCDGAAESLQSRL
ncbi:Abi family protein [Gordonibacter sp.]|uniref:Abi family protein n=1 Tax=Gordonibacter sp. TaxID=1968902 RepID=UPI003FA5AABA